MHLQNIEVKGGDEQKGILISFYKAIKSFGESFPILIGVVLLLGLFKTFVSKQSISSIFTGDVLQDTVTGSLMGSFLAGNPITSYIIGGELLEGGVSLFAVTAFIVTWVTVGVIQFPAEASILGKRFAITRNVLSFIIAIVVSIGTVTILTILP